MASFEPSLLPLVREMATLTYKGNSQNTPCSSRRQYPVHGDFSQEGYGYSIKEVGCQRRASDWRTHVELAAMVRSAPSRPVGVIP